MNVVALALLCASTVAQYDKIRADFDKLQAGKYRIPNLHKNTDYAADCFTKAHLPINADAMSLLQAQEEKNVPGAGIEKFTPFEQVFMDGFQNVECVKDY